MMLFESVSGKFLAPDGTPLSGSVVFTPAFSFARDTQAVTLPAPVTVQLDAEGRVTASLQVPDASTQPTTWTWKACPRLRHAGGAVGLAAITTEGGELIFTLTDGSESRIPAPQGVPGTGVAGISLEGDELVFALTDGSETRLPAPVGTDGQDGDDGQDGVGISTITLEDGELAIALTDGSVTRLPAPKGDPGEDGISPPAPTLRVGEVATLPTGSSAVAEITGVAPDYTLTLGVPQGAKGDPGKDAVIQDTGWYDITDYTNPPAGATVQGRLYLRRVGPQVFLYAHGYTFGGSFTARNFFAPGLCDYTRPPGTKFGSQMRAAGNIFIGDRQGVGFIYDWLGPTDLRLQGFHNLLAWGITSWLTDTPFPINVLGTPGWG